MRTSAMRVDISGPVSVLILVTAAAAVVPPPQNITVSCQNLQTTISWDYSDQTPQTSFRLIISGSAGYLEKLTEEHQYDLTPFVWASVERYTGFHYVKVTAIQGDQESIKVDSPTLTFNSLKTADKKCQLDFPPVDLTVKDSKATVSLPNPHQFYEELRQATLRQATLNQDSPGFSFIVTSDGMQYEGECRLKETICRLDFTVLPSQEEYCITLEGDLFYYLTDKVQFKETGPICAKATDQGSHLILFAILLSAFVIVTLVIILAVCKEKAWVRTTPTPKCLVWSLLSNPDEPERRWRQSARTGPMIISEVEDLSETQTDSTLYDLSLTTPTGSLYAEGGLLDGSNQEMETEEPTSASCGSEGACAECVHVDLEGYEERSPYDRPQRLEVDMDGHGDVVEAYCGR